jgi:hypothetical protein
MRSKKKDSNQPAAPIYRSIKKTSGADASSVPSAPHGHIGEAAVNAAARHQLHRYAQDIEDYIESSRMDALLNQLQATIDLDEVHRRG